MLESVLRVVIHERQTLGKGVWEGDDKCKKAKTVSDPSGGKSVRHLFTVLILLVVLVSS